MRSRFGKRDISRIILIFPTHNSADWLNQKSRSCAVN